MHIQRAYVWPASKLSEVLWGRGGKRKESLQQISLKNFRQMVLVFFGTENRNGIELYHLQNTGKFFAFLSTWSLALVIQTYGAENFGRFGKNGQKVIPWKGLLFFAENFYRVEPFQLNSARNFRVFHTNDKRSTSLEFEYLRNGEPRRNWRWISSSPSFSRPLPERPGEVPRRIAYVLTV